MAKHARAAMVPSAGSENKGLNLLRFAAAMFVVLGHVRLLFFQNYSDTAHTKVRAVLYAVTSIGGQAVVVFFVLSGFWVGGGGLRSVRAGRFSPSGYGLSRLTRLWIVLIPALVLTAVADGVGKATFSGADPYRNPSLYVGIPAHPVHDVGSFFGNLAFLQYLPPLSWHVQVYGTNQPLWSLTYEFWYYVAFPAAVIALSRRFSTKWRLLGAVVAVLAMLIAGRRVLELAPTWLIGAGVAAYREPIGRWLSGRRSLVPWLQGGLAGATFGAAIVVRQKDLGLPGDYLLAGVAALMIASLIADGAWTSRVGRLGARVSGYASWSYSLYAMHMPLIVLAAAIITPTASKRWDMTPTHVALGCLILLVLVAATAVLGSLTEKRTETVRQLLRRRPLVMTDSVSIPVSASVDRP